MRTTFSRKTILKALCLLALTLTEACVPILPHVDYTPSMAGGEVSKDKCWGKPSVRYESDGIAFTSRVTTWPGDVLRVEFLFDVPAGITVEWSAHDVAIESPPAAAKSVRIPGISLTGNATLPMEPVGPMVGRDVYIYAKKTSRHFWVFVPLVGVDMRDFIVTLPILNINGRAVSIPPIRFERDLRVQLIAPLQC